MSNSVGWSVSTSNYSIHVDVERARCVASFDSLDTGGDCVCLAVGHRRSGWFDLRTSAFGVPSAIGRTGEVDEL